jgi:hypothetical protein
MRAAKKASTTETQRHSSGRRSCVSVSLWLILASGILAGLLNAPAAFTQNRKRPAGTQRPARPAQTPQTSRAPAGPYVQPPPDEPPPNPWLKPAAEPPPEKGEAGRQSDQRGRADDEVDENEVVRINASEVMLPVTVRDAEGRLVTGLGRDDFKVFEDGREQPLSDLSLRQVPVDVALLVDSSSSVAESFEDVRRAAEEFSSRVAADDRFCLVKFDDRVELLLDWSKSRLQLRRALGRLSTGVFTRFNDALLDRKSVV